MASAAPYELSIDQQALKDLGKALKSEADGKTLRKDLIAALKGTGDDAITDMRAAALAIPSKGLAVGPSIRQEIARKITPTVRLSGQMTGVALTAKQTSLRGFTMAARRMNRDVGFNHPVYGRGAVHQVGRPNWFDEIPPRYRDDFHRDVMFAIERLALTLAERARAAAGH